MNDTFANIISVISILISIGTLVVTIFENNKEYLRNKSDSIKDDIMGEEFISIFSLKINNYLNLKYDYSEIKDMVEETIIKFQSFELLDNAYYVDNRKLLFKIQDEIFESKKMFDNKRKQDITDNVKLFISNYYNNVLKINK